MKFFHWNLNIICARGAVKIPLIEAYDSVYKFDLIAISETMLNSTIGNDVISIDGFSREIYRADHPSDNKIGGVCLYFREGLPIKRRKDLEFLQEMIVAEITISRNKILFSTIYRSPSQNSEQFENFIDRLHRSLNVMQRERPPLMILTGDLNCRSSQWWPQDMEEPQGMALEELIETNNLHQLIDEPTNIRGEAMSCIDLITTDQPNLFLQSGVHSSLDQNCQHQIIYGKINISLPPTPPYKRTVWEYGKANVAKIKADLNAVDWKTIFCGLGSEEMADIFTNITFSILSENIPYKIINVMIRILPG